MVASLEAHAREAAPAECCGLFVGRDTAIVEAVRTANLSADPNRFLIDAKDHFDALRSARERGLEVVGFYHSHPRSPAVPSATDLLEASYPDHLYMIVSLATPRAGLRLYKLTGGVFQELGFTIVS